MGAGAREVKTNSGEGSLERCVSKVDFQGAGGVVRWAVVEDMVRRRVRRRRLGGEAMMDECLGEFQEQVELYFVGRAGGYIKDFET